MQVIRYTMVGVDKSTVPRLVRRVTLAIAAKLGDFVKLPQTRQEKAVIKQDFYDIGGFPCVIGCVDGSHIRIIAPSQNLCNYVNRKSFHSINNQGICDHKGKRFDIWRYLLFGCWIIIIIMQVGLRDCCEMAWCNTTAIYFAPQPLGRLLKELT